MLMLGNKRGQSALEYGLIITIVVAALLAINIYMKKGVQGRLKESTDRIGRQFEPTSFTTSWRAASSGSSTTTETRDTTTGGTTSTISASPETINRSEYETWGTLPTQHSYDE